MSSQQQTMPRPMMAATEIPSPQGTANVVPDQNQQGHICAQGGASRPDGSHATTVYARIYSGQLSPGSGTVPSTPPADATSTNPQSYNWSFASVPGAAYGTTQPLPWNTLVIWAEFADGTYDMAFTPFQGQQATTTDCGT